MNANIVKIFHNINPDFQGHVRSHELTFLLKDQILLRYIFWFRTNFMKLS